MDIAKVSQASGLPASTIRYYEEKGLIQSIGRHGLRRQFDRDVVQRLALISLACGAGFSLDEIAQMFSNGKTDINRRLLRHKADELDHKIELLTSMRDGLRHAAECPAPSHFECPTFLRFLRIASKKPFRHTNRLKVNNSR